MPSNSLSSIFLKYGRLITGIAWLISTLIYLKMHGVVTELEAAKYIEEAHRYIDTGAFSAPRFYFYSATIFIMAFAIKIHIGMFGAFIVQALLNLFAYIIFYKALTKIFQSPFTPILIIFYLLAFSPYQSWVVFLYTESIFFSSILILISVLILYKPDSLKNTLFIGLALFFTLISRPLGILLGVGVYLYFFYNANKKWKIFIACGSVVMIALGYFFINTIFSSIHDWHITQAFEEESIICDLPAKQPYQKLDLVKTGSPVYQLWYYLTHNFYHFLRFAGIKLQYFFLMTRNYYSSIHNFFLLLNALPVYLLALGSFFIKKQYFSKGIIAFLVITILVYAATIVFQCDDYHNRFILSIYPFFVLLAARSMEHFCLPAFKNNK
jgi:hypothetical protein